MEVNPSFPAKTFPEFIAFAKAPAVDDADQETKEANEAVQEIVDCLVATNRHRFSCSSAKLPDLWRLL
jgi:hypothetical protein